MRRGRRWGICDEVTGQGWGRIRSNRRSRGGDGGRKKGSHTGRDDDENDKKRVHQTSTSDNEDEDYYMMTAIGKYGLLYPLVGVIIKAALHYKSKIGPKLPHVNWVSITIDPE